MAENQYKLSVITICYNEPDVEKTCESIVNQTWQDFEWIVIDGGSNEETQKILDKYKSRMNYFVSEKDNGIYDACNKGIDKANGEYLNFMNAGDSFYQNDVLEQIFVKNNYNGDILYGNEYQETLPNLFTRMPKKITKKFLITSTLRHQASFIKKELFIKYGKYDERYRIVADYEKWLCFYYHNANFKYIPNVVSAYKGFGLSSENSKMLSQHKLERHIALEQYWSKSDITHVLEKNESNSFLQNIFSIRNRNGRKNITFLGIKIKFKTKKLKKKINKPSKSSPSFEQDGVVEFLDFSLNVNIRENSILMVETNACHGEVLVGMAKMFMDLGFNVDVIFSKKEKQLNLFEKLTDKRLRCFTGTPESIRYILFSYKVQKYKYVYINTDIVGCNNKASLEYFNDILLPQNRIIQFCHRLESINPELYKGVNLLNLANLPCTKGLSYSTVSPHMYYEVKEKQKNEFVKFVVVGNIQAKRKNFDLLIRAMEQLVKKKVNNFKVTVIARDGNFDFLPLEVLPHLDFKGCLSYPDMWKKIEESDFVLPLLDPDNKDHERYITCGASGSFQLVYGFRKPCLLASKFANLYSINSDNSIVYETNEEFVNAMYRAIQMNNDEYQAMTKSLAQTADELYSKSLNNIANIVKKEAAEKVELLV